MAFEGHSRVVADCSPSKERTNNSIFPEENDVSKLAIDKHFKGCRRQPDADNFIACPCRRFLRVVRIKLQANPARVVIANFKRQILNIVVKPIG